MTTPEKPPKAPPLPLKRLPQTLFNRRWWWVTLIVLLGLLLLLRLGNWQLDRLEQRRAENAILLAQLNEPPLSLDAVVLPADLATIENRLAEAGGVYDFENQVLVNQQIWQGALGAHIITPLRIEGSDRAILVNRGWIPAAQATAETLAQFDEPGHQTVNGRLQLTQALADDRRTVPETAQLEWYRVDVEAIQRQIPYEILPVYLLQEPTGLNDSLPYRVEAEIDLSEGPHLSYALQWFFFALMLFLGYGRYVMVHGNGRSPTR